MYFTSFKTFRPSTILPRTNPKDLKQHQPTTIRDLTVVETSYQTLSQPRRPRATTIRKATIAETSYQEFRHYHRRSTDSLRRIRDIKLFHNVDRKTVEHAVTQPRGHSDITPSALTSSTSAELILADG
ncbi:unnamed protein product [Macrosiphum euphorbiae]|uniref:Uncharacterized protein n=1 Tax=Macrosiphum euphorbiae TaxID=13131 RepID=A0AAV0VQB9_9HEMI|nr:unnamed protein product [Macrosiphum euphorbiae]